MQRYRRAGRWIAGSGVALAILFVVYVWCGCWFYTRERMSAVLYQDDTLFWTMRVDPRFSESPLWCDVFRPVTNAWERISRRSVSQPGDTPLQRDNHDAALKSFRRCATLAGTDRGGMFAYWSESDLDQFPWNAQILSISPAAPSSASNRSATPTNGTRPVAWTSAERGPLRRASASPQTRKLRP
jgi:hypothetical protein